MPLFFLGTREWRNRQTRTVQVRVPVMEWGFNSPLAHDETADPSGSAVFVFPGCGGGVAAPVFACCLLRRWCSGRCVCFVGPGCLVRPWAAARPRAARAASLRLGASSRSPARPRRRPRVPQPGPPASSGALHTSGAWCAGVCLCVASKLGLALPSPSGTAASPCGPSCGCFVGGSGGFAPCEAL